MDNVDGIAPFFDQHIRLLKRERDAEIEQSSLLLSNCSPKLLEQRGLALLNLNVLNITIGLGGRSLIELRRSSAVGPGALLPSHTFRPGDLGRIESHSSENGTSRSKKPSKTSAKDANDKSTIEGVIYKVTESRVIVAVDSRDEDTDTPEIPARCRLVKLANSVTYDRMDKTLGFLKDTLVANLDPKPKRQLCPETLAMIAVLLGRAKPSCLTGTRDYDFYDKSLNESQRKAVKFTLASNEVACIHGPPGTGKTHTLAEIIRQILSPRVSGDQSTVKHAEKILVCGASNLSVDNILEKLLVTPPGMTPLRCTRIGHPARIKGTGSVLDATLDAQSSRTDQAELLKDVKSELTSSLSLLAGTSKGQKGIKPRGEERKKLWRDVRELRKEYRKRERGIVKSVISDAQVVVATCHSSGGRTLDNIDFDVVIVDEATQALEAACWIPILKGKKLILAGDPKQLPPTILSTEPRSTQTKSPEKALRQRSSGKDDRKQEVSPESSSQQPEQKPSNDGVVSKDISIIQKSPSSTKKAESPLLKLSPPKSLEVTLFERLESMYGESIKVMLNVQYRMNKTICDFPSKAMYDSRLLADESVAGHLLGDIIRPTDDTAPEEPEEVLNTPVVFFDTTGCEYYEGVSSTGDDGSKFNEYEANVVKSWVAKLVSSGVSPSQIAILAPYQAQVSLISTNLFPLYGTELEIGTVDGMQGREKEAILISLVRSNEKREVGFLKDERRLNVAMTRARRHMCVIGDSSTVQTGSTYLKKWMRWLEENADVYYGGLQI